MLFNNSGGEEQIGILFNKTKDKCIFNFPDMDLDQSFTSAVVDSDVKYGMRLFDNVTNVDIKCENILTNAFRYTFGNFPWKTTKIKVHAKTIQNYAFQNIGPSIESSTNMTYIWIPSEVKTVGQAAFNYCRQYCEYRLIICCEASSKPNEWASDWDLTLTDIMHTSRYSTTWGVTEAAFDAM